MCHILFGNLDISGSVSFLKIREMDFIDADPSSFQFTVSISSMIHSWLDRHDEDDDLDRS